MQPLPDDLYISFTSWRRFQECQLQEYLLRAQVPRAEPDRRSYLVGDVVHKAIERRLEGRDDQPLAEVTRELFGTYVDRHTVFWKNLSDRDTLCLRAQKCAHMLEPYVDAIAKQEVKAEQELYTPLPDHLNVFVTAKTDAVIYDGDKVKLLDFKTSVGYPKPDQLKWARVVFARALGVPPGNVLAAYVCCNYETGVVKLRDALFDPGDVEETFVKAAEVADTLLRGMVESDPGPGKCGRCRARISCADAAISHNENVKTRGRK